MIIKCEIDLDWASSIFDQLYGSIHYWKMDDKDIADAIKLVKKLVWCLLEWGSDKRLH